MAYPVRAKRLAFYVAVILLPVLLGYVIEQTAVALAVHGQFTRDLPVYQRDFPSMLRQDLRRYGHEAIEMWPIVLPDEHASADFQIAWIEAQLQKPMVLHHSRAAAALEAVFLPFSRRSNATMEGVLWGSLLTYPAPCRLHRALARDPAAPMSQVLTWVAGSAAYFGWCVLMYVLLPLCFIALPISRRRASVRWRHLVRISAYGLFIPVVILSKLVIGLAVALVWSSAGDFALGIVAALVFVVMLPWILMWWIAAIDRHLRMEQTRTVTIAVVVMALLASTAIMYAVNDALVFVPLSRLFPGS